MQARYRRTLGHIVEVGEECVDAHLVRARGRVLVRARGRVLVRVRGRVLVRVKGSGPG